MSSQRMRIRDLIPHLDLGHFKPGPLNSLTDVPGVKVHTQESHNEKGTINTGVTCITPRDDWYHKACYASVFGFNGCGELTGSHWINESGMLHSPICITGSFNIGAAYQGIQQYTIKSVGEAGPASHYDVLPVVAETYDGYLNDVTQFPIKTEDVVRGLESVSTERVREGNVGGGTGMMCHHFKGGTGSSSRLVESVDATGQPKTYTIAALVQANYGRKQHLRIGGVPVGKHLISAAADEVARDEARKDGSIIVVIATDAPLHPTQLQRIAKRATVGLARVGGHGFNSSGDIFLAFSTANEVPLRPEDGSSQQARVYTPEALSDFSIDGLFEAASDATEESIYNALCMAETTVGFEEHRVEALPLEKVKAILEKHL
ncbi:hypothetical protein M409DRAFT_66045 [Zasmidium cellare ATCC 36951]|uniref:Peptidase family T4 protein n=1 Tax=Zasmidium cellare ATCC 36951 TaxID=1080233 RepID=A0A6A6CJT2_ZASCE|nr:uncharacterized protein M409DRAFT_66045 [Zasmidium cellare ATCC 36951]KAF2167487.1 hypothetical protein M409DRAFT_66045 [Zasmidium cellare ATCC 36951]